MYFICLSIWEWNNINSLVLIPNILFNSLIISATNCSLLSNMIFSSNFHILSLNNLVNSSTNISFVIVTKYVILDNLLQTTRIASFLATNGNFVIKSTIRYIYGFSRTLLNLNFSAGTFILFFIF